MNLRSIRLREGARTAGTILADAGWLARGSLSSVLPLGALLALLPALLRAGLIVSSRRGLLSLWEALLMGRGAGEGFFALLSATLQTAMTGFEYTLLEAVKSLLLTPLLLASLALVFNRYASAPLPALRQTLAAVKRLVLVALALWVADWFAGIAPSIISGLLAAVAGLLSFIPILGTVAAIVATALSLAASLLTDFAVNVLFLYVWIAAACESVGGFSALARSWQITRLSLRDTIAALLGLMVCKWLALLLCGAIWYIFGRFFGLSITALIYAAAAVYAVFLVMLGALASALYLRRPASSSYIPPNFGRMKRANPE